MNDSKSYNDKFRNLVLYILEKDSYKEGGIKKLNKLLYFIDFYYYRDHERLISDMKYAKADMGPILDGYKVIFQNLVERGDLEVFEDHGTTSYRSLKQADISEFSPSEIDHICKVLDVYGKLSGADLESISHEQQPWVLTENIGDLIDPDLALLMNNEVDETITTKSLELVQEVQQLADRV